MLLSFRFRFPFEERLVCTRPFGEPRPLEHTEEPSLHVFGVLVVPASLGQAIGYPFTIPESGAHKGAADPRLGVSWRHLNGQIRLFGGFG
jgi:hypothetical protein